MSRLGVTRVAVLASFALLVDAATIEWPGRPDDEGSASNNTAALNAALAALLPGDTLSIPNRTFWLAGGVRSTGLVNATLRLDGTLRFLAGRKGWPVEACGHDRDKKCVQKAILIADARGLTLTSAGAGMVDGNGASWWGYINYLIHAEDRPKLLTIQNATDVLVEHWHFRQSAYHTFHADDVARVEIRAPPRRAPLPSALLRPCHQPSCPAVAQSSPDRDPPSQVSAPSRIASTRRTRTASRTWRR